MSDSWEKRSRTLGATLRSVLFKGFPEALNQHLDGWHRRVVLAEIEAAPESRVLDVGCGYGRLTEAMLERHPGLQATGLDISQHFVDLFHERTGRPAVRGTLEDLPQRLEGFQRLVCVTVLMYVPDELLQTAMNKLIGALEPGGRMVLIESHRSGLPYLTAFGLLGRGSQRGGKDLQTGGRYFRPGQIEQLVAAAGGRIVDRRRIPATSLAILPLAALTSVLPDSIGRSLLRPFGWLDDRLAGWRLPSLHMALVIEKPT